MASIRIRTKVQGEMLALPELRLFVGKTVDIEVTERPDETAEAANGLTDSATDHLPSLAFLADLDAHPLRTPGLSPAGAVRVNLVAAGPVLPLPLSGPDDQL